MYLWYMHMLAAELWLCIGAVVRFQQECPCVLCPHLHRQNYIEEPQRPRATSTKEINLT